MVVSWKKTPENPRWFLNLKSELKVISQSEIWNNVQWVFSILKTIDGIMELVFFFDSKIQISGHLPNATFPPQKLRPY